MTGSTQATVAVATPAFAKRPARALIGWMTEEEGALWLAGRDIQAAANNIALRSAVGKARTAVATRAPLPPQQGITSALPEALAIHITAFMSHPSAAQVVVEAGSPLMVDLARLRAIQPVIHIEDAKKRFEGVDLMNLAAIAAITLPIPPASPPELQPIFDHAKQAWIMASPNPNLRVMGGFSNTAAEIAPGVKASIFGFAVGVSPSFLRVGVVNGRHFLVDGYHRAYGLLASGVTQAPALVREYNQLQEARLQQGMLSPDVFLGDQPPLLPDYLDQAVSADTLSPLVSKMIVIQALEVTPLG
jgi:hypothetical protein